MAAAAREGAGTDADADARADVAFVQFAGEACAHRPWLRNEILICAARHGCTPVCRALVEGVRPGKLFASKVCSYAAEGGHRDTLEWARSAGFPWREAFFFAAKGGHADLVRWMHEQPLLDSDHDHDHDGSAFREDTVKGAAAGGHLPLLQWAVSLGWSSTLGYAWDAASGGHTHVLQWMADSGADASVFRQHRCAMAAASQGRVAALEWLVRRGAALSAICVRSAAANGHLRVLQFMRDQGWDLRCAYLLAVQYGHTAIVRWLHDAGYGGDGLEATALAAETAHAETLSLLHSDLGVPVCRTRCSQVAGVKWMMPRPLGQGAMDVEDAGGRWDKPVDPRRLLTNFGRRAPAEKRIYSPTCGKSAPIITRALGNK
jgi:hypothetical protein